MSFKQPKIPITNIHLKSGKLKPITYSVHNLIMINQVHYSPI